MVSVLWIRDFYPGSLYLIHPGSNNSNKRGGGKNFLVVPFFVATTFKKLKFFFTFELEKNNILANLQKIIVPYFLPKKLSLSSQKFGFLIRDPEKTYPGSRNQEGSKRHRIRICNTLYYYMDCPAVPVCRPWPPSRSDGCRHAPSPGSPGTPCTPHNNIGLFSLHTVL